MALYNIYHGLCGNFGGAKYDYTRDFKTKEEAEKIAYEAALEDYDSCITSGDVNSWYDLAQIYIEDENLDCEIDELNEDVLNEIDISYRDAVESCIDYKAVRFDEDDWTDYEILDFREK